MDKKNNSFVELYQKRIMEHFHHSPYRGRIEHPDFVTDEISPSCGDHIIFTVISFNHVIADIQFTGEGSIVGQAAASMVCEKVKGMDFDAILQLTVDDIHTLLGIPLGPNRLRTVTFVLATLQKGVAQYISMQGA